MYRLAMTPRRTPRPRVLILVVGIFLLLAAALLVISVTMRPTAAPVPLDPAIPNERALIAAGLSGTPGPGQPALPVAVDRVVVDGAATYIQYRIIQPLGTVDNLTPGVTDDRGRSSNVGSRAILVPDDGYPMYLLCD